MVSSNMAIIIFALLLLVESCITQENPSKNIRFVSINSKAYEGKYNMEIKEDIECGLAEKLNLDEMDLRIVKEDIIQSEAIRHISLQKNFLQTIPKNIFKHVQRLYCLNLARNKINLYSSNPFQHYHLRILDLSYQDMPKIVYSFSEIEDSAEEMKDIYKSIIFNNTDIFLPNIEYLILSGNEISTLSSDFYKSFPQLTHLYLNDISADILEPKFFGKIPTTLRVLQLKNNNFLNLTLQNMEGVSHLYLDGNPLRELYITSKNVKILSLSNCTSLDHASINTPYLEYIDLSKNNLVSNIFLSGKYQSLRTILLDHNKFSKIPVLTGAQIIKLSLSYNVITYIPQNILANLISLKELSLKGNRIQQIEGNAFLDLKNLEYLDLSENLLKSLSHDWLLPLINLRYLNMSSNQFENLADISINSISSLQHLFVKNNIFTEVTTTELVTLPNSITVYLA